MSSLLDRIERRLPMKRLTCRGCGWRGQWVIRRFPGRSHHNRSSLVLHQCDGMR